VVSGLPWSSSSSCPSKQGTDRHSKGVCQSRRNRSIQ
jgi:hypothetical protein